MNPSSPQRTLTTQELRDLIDTERDRVNLKRDALRKGSRRRSLEQQQKQQEEASSPPRAPLFHLPSETYSSTAKQLLRSSSSTMPSQQDTPKSIYADGVVESVETEHDKDVYMTVSISPIDNTHASDHSSDEEDLKEFAEDKDVPPPFPSNRRRRMVPLAVGIAAITAIAVGVYFFLDNNNVSLKSGAQHADFQGTVTAAELVEHNTPEDCWVLIGGTVYDLTEYAPTHPGGGRLITDLAGTDATKEYELEHPLSLMSTLPETIIGAIEEGYVPVYKNDDDESEDDDGTPFVATTAAPPPVEDPPVEDPPMEDPPVEDPPVEDPPVEDPPVEDPPVEDPPVEDPPVEDPPANVSVA
jgi:cytochrome b involved in lipid metabolism